MRASGDASTLHRGGIPASLPPHSTRILPRRIYVCCHVGACKLGLEGIVSKRKESAYRSGRSPDWLKMKNSDAPAVKREDEEDWGKKKWR